MGGYRGMSGYWNEYGNWVNLIIKDSIYLTGDPGVSLSTWLATHPRTQKA